MQHIQMQQVRVDRASQVPVPPSKTAPLDLSRELRQQLRVTRHRAFKRHQENAQWTKELLERRKTQNDEVFFSSKHAASIEELENQVMAKKQAVEELEKQLAQQKEAQEAAQSRFEEIVTTLKSVEFTAVKECEKMVASEKLLLLPSKPRKMEIVQL